MKRLVLVAAAIVFAATMAGADRDRTAAFARAISALEKIGDADGVRALETLRDIGPIMPPELPPETMANSTDATKEYQRHQLRLALFRLADRIHSSNDRYLHRAEAALHLVAIEIAKGPGEAERHASPALITRFLREAEWALRLAGTPPARTRLATPEIELTATPTVVGASETAVLRWAVTNADQVFLDARRVPLTGEETRHPVESEYHHLTVERDGVTSDASLWIIVTPEPIRPAGPAPGASISAMPSRILLGESVIISWNARGGETITLNGDRVAARDSVILFPTTSGRYRLISESGNGRAQASAQVYVFGRRPSPPTPAPVEKAAALDASIEETETAAETPVAQEIVVILFEGRNPRPPYREELEKIAARLRSNAALRIRVEGHADRSGNEDANRRITRERAEIIKRLLIRDHGCDAERIETEGYGSTRPATSNETAAGRRLNRRVEIRVVQ